MALDKVSVDASIAVTTGVLTLTSRIYANPALIAAFGTLSANGVTVTLGPGNVYMDVVSSATPNVAVGVYAEAKKFVSDRTNEGAGTLL